MSKKEFYKKCQELEKSGWYPVDFQPIAKKAIYQKNGVKVTIS